MLFLAIGAVTKVKFGLFSEVYTACVDLKYHIQQHVGTLLFVTHRHHLIEIYIWVFEI